MLRASSSKEQSTKYKVQRTKFEELKLNTFLQDIRYGVRMLLKQKSMTAIALLSLALGIGANTALFSIIDAMLLKMLPVHQPERLVLFRSVAPREFSAGNYNGSTNTDPETGLRSMTSFPYLAFERMRQQDSPLTDVFAFGSVSLNVNADGEADVAVGQAVSGNYYVGLGVQPAVGRVLNDEDDKAGASPVAVLSYRYWQKRFGGNNAVVGKQINLNNLPFTIVGVSSPGFDGTMGVGTSQDVTIPIAIEPQMYVDRRRSYHEWCRRLVVENDGSTETRSHGRASARATRKCFLSVCPRASQCAPGASTSE